MIVKANMFLNLGWETIFVRNVYFGVFQNKINRKNLCSKKQKKARLIFAVKSAENVQIMAITIRNFAMTRSVDVMFLRRSGRRRKREFFVLYLLRHKIGFLLKTSSDKPSPKL
jgi:hypothetical protein